MVIKELVRLKDGRDIVMNLTEEEHFFLLSFAINALVSQGAMQIGGIGANEGEVIGTAPEGEIVH